MRPLRGKVVVVTGAGNGLGRAYAIAAAAAGARVVVNDWGRDVTGAGATSSEAADAVVAEIHAAGGEALASTHDVSVEADADAIIATAVDAWGQLDGVVCNAGHARTTPLATASLEDFRSLLDVHLVGSWLVCRAALRAFDATGCTDGRIVTTTSSGGLWGLPSQSGYTAAKAGITGLTACFAAELAPHGIAVNCLAPGGSTRMTGEQPDARDPSLVAPLVVWLLSDDALGVTGRTFESSTGTTWVLDGWRRCESTTFDATTPFDEVSAALRKAVNAAPVPNGPLSFGTSDIEGPNGLRIPAHRWDA